jgi:hypothetical protein
MSKEKRPKPEKKPEFQNLELEVFENEEFAQTFLSHHGADVSLGTEADIERGFNHYTLFWPYGFMAAVPMEYGQELGNIWGCIFIYLWLYKGVIAEDADDQCNKHVYKLYKTRLTERKEKHED